MEHELARLTGTVEIGEPIALAGAKATRRISFTFGVADEANDNRDFVPRDELDAVVDRLVGQGIDLLHEFPLAIGAFVSPIEFHEQDKRMFFGGTGNLWEWRFPKEMAAIDAAHRKRLLAGSMEMGFEKAECSECGQGFGGNSPYGQFFDHARKAHQGKGHRILRGLDPRGAGILLTDRKQPGYEGTEILALAERRRDVEVRRMADQDKDTQDGQQTDTSGAGDPPEKPQATADSTDYAKQVGELSEQMRGLKRELKTAADERDAARAKVKEFEERDRIAALADERIEKLTAAARKQLKNEKFEFPEDLLGRIASRAKTAQDDSWAEFGDDVLAFVQPAAAAAPATASRRAGNDPPPTGTADDKDDDEDGKRDRFAETRKHIRGMLGDPQQRGQLAIAARAKRQASSDDAGGE